MTNEEAVTSHIYNILAMSSEPLSAAEIGEELRPEMSAAEVNALLSKIVTQYGGIGKGYQTGSFVKVDSKWSVKQMGFGKDVSPTDIAARIWI